MRGERPDPEVESLLEAFHQQLREIAAVQRQRVLLTASATSRDKRITVTVNANGIVIDIRFTPDIGELSHDEIAKELIRLAQEAAATVARRGQELIEPLTARQHRLPKVSEVVEGMPDFATDVPLELPVSIAAPGSPERRELEAQAAALEFADTEQFDDRQQDIGSIRQAW